MQLNVNEARPYKHNKAFYPALIEIQNIIQQTEAAMNSGVLTSLPKVIVSSTVYSSIFNVFLYISTSGAYLEGSRAF